jgi:hypothetical protein
MVNRCFRLVIGELVGDTVIGDIGDGCEVGGGV